MTEHMIWNHETGKFDCTEVFEVEIEEIVPQLKTFRDRDSSDLERNERIAITILNQLGGSVRLQSMIGAKTYYRDGPSIGFQFAGSPMFNAMKITLDESDTYTVRFMRYNRGTIGLQAEKIFSDIYADGLVELFEEQTGLKLSL